MNTHHRFYLGDSLEVLRRLPDESVHCCVTSPPYFGLRDYGIGGQIGLEPSIDEYVDKLVQVFREVRRVLRKDGTLWCNLGDSYAGSSNGTFRPGAGRADGQVDLRGQRNRNGTTRPNGLKSKDLIGIPWRVAFALQADGWWLRSHITWAKKSPMPESVSDRPTRSTEDIFLLARKQRYFYDAQAVAEPGVSGDPNPPQGSRTIRPSGEEHQNKGARTRGPGNWGVKPIGIPGEYEGRGRSPRIGRGALTRNMRDVWFLGPEPFPEAHFATFPTEVPRRSILAGCPEHTCPTCGAPWARLTHTEKVGPERNQTGAKQRMATAIGIGKHTGHERYATRYETQTVTDGFGPTCGCAGNDGSEPGVVLDPFGGAGTVSLVAKMLGRSSIYIDLNPDYLQMAVKRCNFGQLELTRTHTHEVIA